MKSETSFPLPLNRHDHMTIEVTGLGLTGEESLARLQPWCHIFDRARITLQKQVYNDQHRLVRGRRYRIVIVRADQIRKWVRSRNQELSRSESLFKECRDFLSQFKYRLALAEVAMHLREMLTQRQLVEMGIYSLMVAHNPIKTWGEYVTCLHVVCHTEGPALGAGLARSFHDRPSVGAVAFLDTNP